MARQKTMKRVFFFLPLQCTGIIASKLKKQLPLEKETTKISTQADNTNLLTNKVLAAIFRFAFNQPSQMCVRVHAAAEGGERRSFAWTERAASIRLRPA